MKRTVLEKDGTMVMFLNQLNWDKAVSDPNKLHYQMIAAAVFAVIDGKIVLDYIMSTGKKLSLHSPTLAGNFWLESVRNTGFIEFMLHCICVFCQSKFKTKDIVDMAPPQLVPYYERMDFQEIANGKQSDFKDRVSKFLSVPQQNRLEIGVIGPNYVMIRKVDMPRRADHIPPLMTDEIDLPVLPFDQGSKSVSFQVLSREWKEILLHTKKQCNLSD